MRSSVKRLDGMDISLEGGDISKGVNQDWFQSYWQRLAGCGPCTGANMMRYFGKRAGLDVPLAGKGQMLRLMEKAWGYLTPGVRGLNSVARFQEGMDRWLMDQCSVLRTRGLEVPGAREKRPALAEVAAFIRAGLGADSPVAFLNLHPGELSNLENWHWVTLIALYEEPEGGLYAEAIDNGRLLLLDIGLWLNTTRQGGGFVYCASGDAGAA